MTGRPPRPASSDLLSVQQVAELAGCTVQHVYRVLKNTRKGFALRADRIGSHWVIRRADAERWAAKRRERRGE